MVLSSDERFLRQIPLIGKEGQEKIGKTRLLIAGAGGLGNTAALFAAMAGFGTIHIIDPDYIEKTNLNRQLYWETDIGRPKAETAAKAIRAVNSSIEVKSVATTIGTSRVRDLIRGMDVVIDGLDNYPARYLLADATCQCGIPFIHGAVNGFYGQVCTIVRPNSPCLRCIVPKPPPVRETPAIGVTTGITGCVQVTEAIKLATGIGTIIRDQLWVWDGIRQKSDRLKIERIQTCHICGQDEYRIPVREGVR